MVINSPRLGPGVLRSFRGRPAIPNMIPAAKLLSISELPKGDRIKADPPALSVDPRAANRFAKNLATTRGGLHNDESLVLLQIKQAARRLLQILHVRQWHVNDPPGVEPGWNVTLRAVLPKGSDDNTSGRARNKGGRWDLTAPNRRLLRALAAKGEDPDAPRILRGTCPCRPRRAVSRPCFGSPSYLEWL